MSYLDWHVGMKVVCRKRGDWMPYTGNDTPSTAPQYGEICTISAFDCFKDEVFISLLGYGETLYDASAFRRIQNRATSIEIFQTLLNPTPDEIAEVELEDSVAELSEFPAADWFVKP